MATKITWEDKEGIQNDESIPRKNKVMDEDMNEIKQAINGNADELNEAQENIGNLQDGQGTANTDITSLKNRVTTLETDNTQNKENIENLQEDNVQNKADISTLKSDNTTNKSNIQELQGKQEQSESNISALQTRTSTLETKTSTAEEEIESLKADNTTNKSNIEELQEDNTQNKSDISDIKEEQATQNANIEDLQGNDATQNELISKLKSALINVETEEAKSLHIEDASEVPAQLKVMGNQEQKTREGYNLLNSSLFDLSEVSDLATFNQKDGTITFNGTANTDINIRSLRKQTIEGTGKENIVIKTLGGSLNGTLRLVAQDTDYGNIKYSQIGTSSFNDKLIENIEYNIFSITITSGTVLNNLKLGFMIVDDSDLDKEYEQYGAMPSPGYSSPVVCLEGSTKISKINNLSNFSTLANGLSSGTYYGLTFEMLNKFSCKISGKPSGNELRFGNTYNSKNILISLEQGKHYKVKNSFNNVSEITLVNSKNNTYRVVYVANKGEIPLQEGDDGISSVRLYPDTNTTYDNEIVTCLIYTQEDDDFIPGQTDYILNIQQEMLQGDYFTKEADGWKEVHGWNKLIFTGTESFQVSSLKNTRMVLLISNAKQNPEEVLAVSNSFLSVTYNQAQQNNLINAICVNDSYLSIDTDEITSVTEFKQILADKYNAGNPIYAFYKLATSTKLPCTKEQSAVLEELNNLDLFEGVNNIITAENIAKMKLYYIANAKKYIDKETSDIKEQLNTINELLSTTATSSLLLDNLQNDLESEVM